MSKSIRLLSSVLVVFCHSIGAALAADSDGPEWIANASGVLDSQRGYLLDASLGFSPSHTTIWTGEISHASTPEANPALNTDAASLRYSWESGPTRVDLGPTAVALGPAGVDLKAHWFDNVGLLHGEDFIVQIPLRGEQWHIAVGGQVRRSSFAPFSETDTIVRGHNGTPVTVTGSVSCDLDNIGYGAELGLDKSPWNVYVRDYQYNYGSARCSYSASGLGSLSRPDLAELRQLAPMLVTSRLSRSAAILASNAAENSLLAAEFAAGGRYALDALKLGLKLGLNYQRDRDELQGLVSNTYTATVGFPVAEHSILQLLAGAAHADQVGTVGFAGVTFKTLL